MSNDNFKRGFSYEREEGLEENDDINIEGFITKLSNGDITLKYESKIKRIDLENNGLEEKIREVIQEE
ncbi:hypothetical protein NBO_34g0023 [Nosema bombycis CQ1]|jgi:hypothetical protein|uniref:Uncharacterized protein n=1 Tax=Nosema bombycis (strain CQ1 / CVCC 102059) TaxID=578461 RepID=R0MMS0_NOSB1|nr:hypothetical protein NBO_34g0023 [Nosema bombycis CQ1]|eukprot:EOB14173.1 hypothetical protein NBO_34g0023 [Nosema bombycis CQ1]